MVDAKLENLLENLCSEELKSFESFLTVFESVWLDSVVERYDEIRLWDN